MVPVGGSGAPAPFLQACWVSGTHLAVDRPHRPDDGLRPIGVDGRVVPGKDVPPPGHTSPILPCQRLSECQHREIIDDGRIKEPHIVGSSSNSAEIDQY